MKTYIVNGIEKATGDEVEVKISADSKKHARIKGEIKEIVVTEVESEEFIHNKRTQKISKKKLKDGEQIERGVCPKCGEVEVLVSGAGYHPTVFSIIGHLVMTLVTAGGWIPFWIGWAIGCHLSKGIKRCMTCRRIIK